MTEWERAPNIFEKQKNELLAKLKFVWYHIHLFKKYLLRIYFWPVQENKPRRKVSDQRITNFKCQHKNLYIISKYWVVRKMSKQGLTSFILHFRNIYLAAIDVMITVEAYEFT